MGLVGFLGLGLIVTLSYILSSENDFDDRSKASSEIAVELSPSGGTIPDEGFDIDLIVNTHGESIDGIDVTLEFTGPIDYANFSQGTIPNCSVTDIRQDASTVSLTCFIQGAQPEYTGTDGVFATVNFRSTENGAATITVSEVTFSVRDDRGEVTFAGGSGTYTATTKVAMVPSPSSGTISSDGLDLDLLINTYDEDIGGVDITLEYTGVIEYVEVANGEIPNCTVSETSHSEGILNLHCFIDASRPTYNGSGDVFAVVTFRSTAEGTGEIVISRVDFSVRDERSEVTFVGGRGSYSTSYTPPSSTPDPTPVSDPTPAPTQTPTAPTQGSNGPLPEASIFDSVGVVGGVLLLVLAIGMFVYKSSNSNENFSMRNKLCLVLFALILTPFFLVSKTHAAETFTLNPTTGSIPASGLGIDIVVDSGGEEIDGVELTVEYEGDVSFEGFESGDIPGCSVDGLERDSYDDIFLYCFIVEDSYTGDSGVFATLNFNATGEGNATVTITSAVGIQTFTIGGAGNYTTTLSSSGTTTTTTTTTTPTQNTNNTSLPQASILDNKLWIVFGGIFTILSVILFTNFSFEEKSIMREKIRS